MNTPLPYLRFPPSPVAARHIEASLLLSADDDFSRPSERLIDLAIAAVQAARGADLSAISARMKVPPLFPEIWPGEHYKLLYGLTAVLKPSLVVEIGTATGLSALSIKAALPPESRLVTFDLKPWQFFESSVLGEQDLGDGRLVQVIADLTEEQTANQYSQMLAEASLIFADAAKDGQAELRLIQNLRVINFQSPPIVVFDDIRVWNMIKIWREIRMPKLDLTSFGHWSGTGLVDWQAERG